MNGDAAGDWKYVTLEEENEQAFEVSCHTCGCISFRGFLKDYEVFLVSSNVEGAVNEKICDKCGVVSRFLFLPVKKPLSDSDIVYIYNEVETE